MFDFVAAIDTLNRMRDAKVIADYAIGGAVAFIIWDEPIATQDLDIVVIVGSETHALDPLRPVFDWLAANGIGLDGEHAMIAGVPVQFLPAWHPLVAEAVAEAATTTYMDTEIRVIRPAYLVASWKIDPSANTFRRVERAAKLIEDGVVTHEEIDALLERFAR